MTKLCFVFRFCFLFSLPVPSTVPGVSVVAAVYPVVFVACVQAHVFVFLAAPLPLSHLAFLCVFAAGGPGPGALSEMLCLIRIVVSFKLRVLMLIGRCFT